MSRVEVISGPERRRWSAVYFYSPDRRGEHPERHLAGYSGILQADAYAGLNVVFQPDRKPGPITKALCWSQYLESDFILGIRASTPMDWGFETARTPDKFRASAEGGGAQCRSRCGRRQALRPTSPTRSGVAPAWRAAPYTRLAVAALPAMAVTSA